MAPSMPSRRSPRGVPAPGVRSSWLDRLQIFADKQGDGGAFTGGAGDLLGAPLPHIPSGEDTGHAGLKRGWLTVRKYSGPIASVDQVVTGHNESPLVQAHVAALQKARVGVEADEHKRAIDCQCLLAAGSL